MDAMTWIESLPEEQRYRALIRRLVQKTRENRVPLNASFELTPCCNLSCKMCYVRLSRKEQEERGRLLTAKEWLMLAEQARDLGVYAINLTGGEVMLRSDFKEIYKNIIDMGVYVDVLSNGTLIDDKMVDFFCQYPPKNIQITLYGFSPEQYQTVCGNAEGFDCVMQSIERLLSANLPVSLATTLINESNDDYLAIHRFAVDRGLKHIVGAYLHQPRERNDFDINDVRIDSSEFIEIENKLRAIDGIQLMQECTSGRKMDVDHVIAKGFLCGGGRNSCHINWQGEMQTCPAFGVLKTYPLRDGFRSAWESLVNQVDQVEALVECQMCEYAAECCTCASMHYSDTKEFGKVSPKLCIKRKKQYES